MDKQIFIGAIGIGGWEEHTRPLIQSVVRHDADVRLRVIDNASHPPYPRSHWTWRVDEDDPWSYPAALNYLVGGLAGECEWLVLMNNDVVLTDSISERVRRLSPSNLHAFHAVNTIPGIRPFLSGWCFILHRDLYDVVGPFDENFYPMYFEDADYSYRALHEGFGLIPLDREEWGIVHAESRHKERRDLKKQWRPYWDANLSYLKDKHDT